jgi:hypothetical protein
MKSVGLICAWVGCMAVPVSAAPDFSPAPQHFHQETATRFTAGDGLPAGPVQLIDIDPNGTVRAFAVGEWFERRNGRWTKDTSLSSGSAAEFVLPGSKEATHLPIPWADVRQIVRQGTTTFLATPADPLVVSDGKLSTLLWPSRYRVNQIALAQDGRLWLASSAGLFRQADQRDQGWEPVRPLDAQGRAWGAAEVSSVTVDPEGQTWFACKAGVGRLGPNGWSFFDVKDGLLPWNEFTFAAAAPNGGIWLGTRLGAIHFDGNQWHYRQGPRWLPHDEISHITIDAYGTAWFATAGGAGIIERKPMTLAAKAEFYEQEIERHIQRTPFGYVAEAHLGIPGDKTSADPQDSDNDGLWTAMYGAGECFAYAATQDARAKARAKKAFEALRFLQKVTQGGSPAPPPGFIARTIRSAELPDPNAGRLEHDRESQKSDSLWKVYEPRWPKSADGEWFWKSDTSSDELDGHFFFYPLYFDLCADTPEEKDRVREVVRGVTDHLLEHRFVLIDHDGRPTRWAVFGPQFLNRDPMWWPERGLNSLSILSYLAAAAHVTGDPKYEAASRELIGQHGYAQNAMFPKVQQGPGSGNQSDDEMAVMCFYTLLRFSKDEALNSMIRASFFRYWLNEEPEMNPFFNFACAAMNQDATAQSPWGSFSVSPWRGWHEDSIATLRGFPLDRLNWPHRNSHRLDITHLPRVRSSDFDSPDRAARGYQTGGKVIPVENRHFNHWNTDPWRLDYGGSGDELAAGTVFLLPYYMGLHHSFIETPGR